MWTNAVAVKLTQAELSPSPCCTDIAPWAEQLRSCYSFNTGNTYLRWQSQPRSPDSGTHSVQTYFTMPSLTLIYNHPYDNEISSQVKHSYLCFASFFTGWMFSWEAYTSTDINSLNSLQALSWNSQNIHVPCKKTLLQKQFETMVS